MFSMRNLGFIKISAPDTFLSKIKCETFQKLFVFKGGFINILDSSNSSSFTFEQFACKLGWYFKWQLK